MERTVARPLWRCEGTDHSIQAQVSPLAADPHPSPRMEPAPTGRLSLRAGAPGSGRVGGVHGGMPGRVRRIVAGSCLGLAAACALLSAAATLPAGAAPNAAALYHEAIATTRDWTVHYVSTSTLSHVTFVASGDAGPASGTQTILVGQGATEESASLIEIGDLTYLKGNPLALQQLAGLSATQATSDMGKWISFSTNNPTYAQVVAGVRSHDVAQETALNGPYAFGGSRTLHGQKVDAVRGTQQDGKKKVKFVLYVRASGRHLLVEEDALGAGGKASGAEHIVFSKWGEPVRPRAPQASLTLG